MSLTTVRCDLDALAAAAVEMLVRRIRGLDAGSRRRIPVELVLRGSHGRPHRRSR
ncbi:substrate-binding domain-containing protein [Agromyces silvae]|uniref:substrate-binding domain-containing protein n=1 Tax=Agromyces silvae TaxID=3388266 RepID=UPI00280A6FCC|nr:substrate-binding domain-containing protein [Agromyces protaetiae]